MLVMVVAMVMIDAAIGRMAVIVVMGIDSQRCRRRRPEQPLEFLVTTHVRRMPRAADVAIEALHLIGRRHHDVEVVRYHQNATADAVA